MAPRTNSTSAETRTYSRPLTGSKGIGRLAVQFLGKRVKIFTTSTAKPSERLHAEVDWDAAITAGELTQAVAKYEMTSQSTTYANGSSSGTKIALHGLNHEWLDAPDDRSSPARELARAVWMLQPPFADAVDGTDARADQFRIDLVSADIRMEHAFRSQLDAVLQLWDARIEGEIRNGRHSKRCTVNVTFRDGDTYDVAVPLQEDLLDQAAFEIRIFKLQGKQPGKIGVEDARQYFSEFGGVHVYDTGFRLPYYGIQQDWLEIQLDHSRRLSVSALLPRELNVPLAMHDLPTSERIFGVVQVNTARELHRAGTANQDPGHILSINVGRDRLVDNDAYRELKRVVRWAIDYYTTRYQLRQDREVARLRPAEPPTTKLERLRETISEVGAEIPPVLHSKLVDEVDDYYDSVEREGRYVERQTALLAPLASAGLAALAFAHEDNRQIRVLEGLVQRLSRLAVREVNSDIELTQVATDLRTWIHDHRATRSVFSALTTDDDRQDVRRFRTGPTVRVVLRNIRPLLRGLGADVAEIPPDLLLPLGTMADWQALLQNILVNASNAMLDSEKKDLKVSGGALDQRTSYLQVSDTGVGVSLDTSTSLFEPFVRRLELSTERRSLGLGGMGLGLTIVRMICEMRHCKYAFIEPEPGFASTFRLTWST